MSEALRRTPFFDIHLQAGAKMVPFGGWDMPVQYEGILSEHHCVRSDAGLFDVSHMGRVEIHGTDAVPFMNYIALNDVASLENYQSHYSAACYEHGGIVDDFLVYKCPDHLLVILNAGNRSKDLEWLHSHQSGFDVDIRDVSDDSVLIALQGPKAIDILREVTDVSVDGIGFQRFTEGKVADTNARIFRTGYTGEDGFELWYPAEDAEKVWHALFEIGVAWGLKPCGLGARDTLRLEAGLCLYGHEIDETTHPLEAGLSWITKLDKGDFIGREALLAKKENGLTRRLVGFKLLERGFPRQGYAILHEGKEVGTVVSGTMSPTLGYGIGTGYVPKSVSKRGTVIGIDIRGKQVPAEVVRLPFYKAGSRK